MGLSPVLVNVNRLRQIMVSSPIMSSKIDLCSGTPKVFCSSKMSSFISRVLYTIDGAGSKYRPASRQLPSPNISLALVPNFIRSMSGPGTQRRLTPMVRMSPLGSSQKRCRACLQPTVHAHG